MMNAMNTETESVSDAISARCICNNCNQWIDFDQSQAGQRATCPSCGLDTILYIPRPAAPDTGDRKAKPAKPPKQPAQSPSPAFIAIISIIVISILTAALIEIGSWQLAVGAFFFVIAAIYWGCLFANVRKIEENTRETTRLLSIIARK